MTVSNAFIARTSPINALQRYNISLKDHNNISLDAPKVRQTTPLDVVKTSGVRGTNLNISA